MYNKLEHDNIVQSKNVQLMPNIFNDTYFQTILHYFHKDAFAPDFSKLHVLPQFDSTARPLQGPGRTFFARSYNQCDFLAEL